MTTHCITKGSTNLFNIIKKHIINVNAISLSLLLSSFFANNYRITIVNMSLGMDKNAWLMG
jgi:hypothetical protein